MYDQRNAFGSCEWDTMPEVVAKIMKEEDQCFGEQRYQWAATLLQGCNGELLMRPGQGAFAGDAFVVKAFAHHVAAPVARWQMGLARDDDAGMQCYAECLVTGEKTDLSFTGYADDLCKKVLLEGASAAELVAK
eukprot:2962784-Lingulodinium_polyedra.AAC.1